MPRALDISAAVARVDADASGQATALFTVTNATIADIAGAPRLACLDGAGVCACRVDGAATRVFKPGITTTLVAAMRVAPGVAGGEYRVRLDIEPTDAAVGTQRGPELILAVAAPPAVVDARASRGWIALLIVALVIVAGLGVGVFALTRPSPERDARRIADAWLAAERRGDAAALAAMADAPHLIDGAVVATRGELQPRYEAFLASARARALAAEKLADGDVVPATATERPASAARLGLDDRALVVLFRDATATPRLRVFVRRGDAGSENAGFALAPPEP